MCVRWCMWCEMHESARSMRVRNGCVWDCLCECMWEMMVGRSGMLNACLRDEHAYMWVECEVNVMEINLRWVCLCECWLCIWEVCVVYKISMVCVREECTHTWVLNVCVRVVTVYENTQSSEDASGPQEVAVSLALSLPWVWPCFPIILPLSSELLLQTELGGQRSGDPNGCSTSKSSHPLLCRGESGTMGPR